MSPPGSSGSARSLLSRLPEESPPAGEAGAAVMIVLRDGRTAPEVLLIERAVRVDDPASGQIGLPGGHVDASDGSLRETALRELAEEVGLSAGDLDGAPKFVSIEDAPRFRLKVGVFAALLSARPGRSPLADPREVADVFWLPLPEVERPGRAVVDTPRGPLEVDAVLRTGPILWGFTLRVLRTFWANQSRPNDL